MSSLEPTQHAYTTDGWYASWADQKYGWPHKFYVEGIRNRDPKSLSVVSATTHLEGARGLLGSAPWVLKENLTKEQKHVIEDDGMGGDYAAYQFAHRDNHFAKFYTEHLHDPAIDPEVIETIERIAGLHFEWLEDGRVAWSKVH
jgi:hypothetical protein